MDICETYSDRKLFCNDWEFYKAAFGSDYSEDFAFKPVDIPHDWLIYNTNDLYETSTGWYRKVFTYQKKRVSALLSALTVFTWTARCM